MFRNWLGFVSFCCSVLVNSHLSISSEPPNIHIKSSGLFNISFKTNESESYSPIIPFGSAIYLCCSGNEPLTWNYTANTLVSYYYSWLNYKSKLKYQCKYEKIAEFLFLFRITQYLRKHLQTWLMNAWLIRRKQSFKINWRYSM